MVLCHSTGDLKWNFFFGRQTAVKDSILLFFKKVYEASGGDGGSSSGGGGIMHFMCQRFCQKWTRCDAINRNTHKKKVPA